MSSQDIYEIYSKTRRKKTIATVILITMLSSLLLISAVTNDSDDPPSITDNVINNLPIYANVSDFTLTNSNNQSYTYSQDDGKIRLVNFFYTKCPGDQGCSLITLRIFQIYSKVRQNNYLDKVNFISIDFDYINDTIQDVYDYANIYTSDTENWQFLFGNKTLIDNVTRDFNFYFEASQSNSDSLTLNHDDEDNPDPYDHSLIVYIIDQQNRIRKYLLSDFWTVEEAYNAIEYLIEENEIST